MNQRDKNAVATATGAALMALAVWGFVWIGQSAGENVGANKPGLGDSFLAQGLAHDTTTNLILNTILALMGGGLLGFGLYALTRRCGLLADERGNNLSPLLA